jgi:hypothetical protein
MRAPAFYSAGQGLLCLSCFATDPKWPGDEVLSCKFEVYVQGAEDIAPHFAAVFLILHVISVKLPISHLGENYAGRMVGANNHLPSLYFLS